MVNNGKKKTPGKRPQTVWGSGRIKYDNVDDDDDDDDDFEIKNSLFFHLFNFISIF